jgi:hypothetical protein
MIPQGLSACRLAGLPVSGKTVALSLVTLAFILIYIYGAVMEANCLLDMSQHVVYQAIVVDRYISYGRRSRYYH